MVRNLTTFFCALAVTTLHQAAAQQSVPLETIPLASPPSQQPVEAAPVQPQTPQPQQPQSPQPQGQVQQPVEAQPQIQVQPQTPAPAQPTAATAAVQGSSGNPSLRATHGSWEVRCIGAGDCVMTQLHRRTAGSADAVFTVIKPKGMTDNSGNPVSAVAEIVVPLGVYLPGGLGLKIDAQPARAAPFERCIEEGCVVRAPISPSVLEHMKTGATATIVIFGAPEKPVQIPISLSGFTAAYNAI